MRDYSNDRLVALLPFPEKDVHKYSRGRVVLLAGSAQYPGAAVLAARAAQRMGAGYTQVITSPKAVATIQGHYPSVVVGPWSLDPDEILVASTPDRPCSYVIGCGLNSTSGKAEKITHTVLAKTNAPVLLDGGALEFIATDKGRLLCVARQKRGLTTVLTPHIGEAARLAESMKIVADNNKDLAVHLARAFNSIVVLKGSDIYISDGKDVCVITQGTSVLAKAGTGDILAGMIGALLAQTGDAFDACVLAAVLHADAGNIVADALTAISATPEDILEAIPPAIINLSQA